MFFILFFLLSGHRTLAAVWENTNAWTPQFEKQYSVWIETHFTPDFFTKGRWAGIKTDCADAVYFARLIFAYENGLPFVVRNVDDSGFISNSFRQFDLIADETERVKAFMELVAATTSSETIYRDTYPSGLSRDVLLPGTLWIRVAVSDQTAAAKELGIPSHPVEGHVEIVKTIDVYGNILKIASSSPRRNKLLTESSWLGYYPTTNHLGFRKWKTPQMYELPEETLPGYSSEQFSLGLRTDGSLSYEKFKTNLKARLAKVTRHETTENELRRLTREFCSGLQARAEVVTEATLTLQQTGGHCFNANDFEELSTPSRDSKLKAEALYLAKMGEPSALKIALKNCDDIPIDEKTKIQADIAFDLIRQEKIISDPNVPELQRWGLTTYQPLCTTSGGEPREAH